MRDVKMYEARYEKKQKCEDKEGLKMYEAKST